jgi:hypothetical protein
MHMNLIETYVANSPTEIINIIRNTDTMAFEYERYQRQ